MKKSFYPSLHVVTLGAMCRRWARCLILILLAALGTFSSMVLQNLVDRQSGGIDAVNLATEIRCTVTDAQGMNSKRLEMDPEIVDMLLGLTEDKTLSEYVRNVRARATTPLLKPEGGSLCRILSLNSDDRLSALNGATVTFYDSWDETALMTDQSVCLVAEDVEVVEDDGAQWIYLQERYSAYPEKTRVIGIIEGGPKGVYYVPYFAPLVDDFTEMRIESCTFDIKDNTKIEESRKVILQYFVEPDLMNIKRDGVYGVLIDDELYQQNIRDYHANLATLELLLPVLVGVCCFIGFFVSYLTTKGRIREYAVMRCLGMSRFGVFALVFEELLILTVIGGALGFLAGTHLDGGITAAAAKVGGIVIGALLLGAAAAAVRVTTINVMKLMKVEG